MTSNQYFKDTPIFDVEYLSNGARQNLVTVEYW